MVHVKKMGLNLLMLCRENHNSFFPDTVYIITKALNGFLMIQRQIER